MLFNLILAVIVVSCRGQSDETLDLTTQTSGQILRAQTSGELLRTQTSGELLPTQTSEELLPAQTSEEVQPTEASEEVQPTEASEEVLPPPALPTSQPPRHCAQAGQICATCDTVSLCIVNGDGMINTINQTCRPDEQCVAGQCVKGALCNYKPFQCSEEGFFPDPYDCKKYQVCLPTAAVDGNDDLMTFECPEGTSYDALSASCGFPLTTDACINRPVPECTQRLQVGVVPSNPNIYYTCVENEDRLAPELRRCPGGGKFKPDKLTCKNKEAETTEKSKDKKAKKSKE